MSTTAMPFDDIRALIKSMPGADSHAAQLVSERDQQLTKPPGALGKLEEIAEWLAAWTGRKPQITRPLVAIFAGNHGVTKQGVSPFPPEVTAQMVANFTNGGAAFDVHFANFTGTQAQLRVHAFAGQQLDRRTGGTRQLGALAWQHFDAVRQWQHGWW